MISGANLGRSALLTQSSLLDQSDLWPNNPDEVVDEWQAEKRE
jgi:hypothetical protein